MALAHFFASTMCTHLQTLRRPARDGGFTLVETMIVSAIVAISAALATPSYLDWLSRHQLRQAVSEITNQMELARMGAMNRNNTVTVTVAVAGGQVTISGTDANAATVIASKQMMPHVTGANPASTAVAFTSLGLRSGGGTTDQVVQISNDRGTTYSFRVTPGGKTNWCAKATCP